MLISVHLPKTAGTSFRQVLEHRFGESLQLDYADRPLHRSQLHRRSAALRACFSPPRHALQGVECIHGHFLPLKYSRLKPAGALRFVTWLRDPIERLASHFYYWQRSYDPHAAGPLHRRMVEEHWDLERFCFTPELCNVYSQFLWRFPLSRFAYLGITEHYDEDVRDFARDFLGVRADPAEARNVNTQRTAAWEGVSRQEASCEGASQRGAAQDGEDEVSRQSAALDTIPDTALRTPPHTLRHTLRHTAAEPTHGRYIQDPVFRQALERHHARDMALYTDALSRRAARRLRADPDQAAAGCP